MLTLARILCWGRGKSRPKAFKAEQAIRLPGEQITGDPDLKAGRAVARQRIMVVAALYRLQGVVLQNVQATSPVIRGHRSPL